jgi:hypothetical protein
MGVVLLVGLAIVTDWTIRLVVLNAKLSGRDSYTDVRVSGSWRHSRRWLTPTGHAPCVWQPRLCLCFLLPVCLCFRRVSGADPPCQTPDEGILTLRSMCAFNVII